MPGNLDINHHMTCCKMIFHLTGTKKKENKNQALCISSAIFGENRIILYHVYCNRINNNPVPCVL